MTKPRRFAEGTKVRVDRSRAEVEALLVKHGATSFASGWDRTKYVAQCEIRGRRLRFVVVPPDPKEYSTARKWQNEERRRWRALVLHVKSKLEMVAGGDVDFDAEFLQYIVLPDGDTVGERVLPVLDHVLVGERAFPPLLPK